MKVYLGIDVGAVSMKAALAATGPQARAALAEAAERIGLRGLVLPAAGDQAVFVLKPRRTRGRPLDAAREVLDELRQVLPVEHIGRLMLTGSGSSLVAETLGARSCNEFQACARGIDRLHPEVRTVFEIGGETSRYLRLLPDPGSGRLGIVDYSTNGDCAAGTGAFLDQQAGRLQYAVEDIGDIVAGTERGAQIAGRCSVFAKSDMIHAQQKGFQPPEVLRGLCRAVAVNYKSAVVKGHVVEAPVALVGGVSANSAVLTMLREVFELADGKLFVPAAAESLSAVGAALLAAEARDADGSDVAAQLARLDEATDGNGYAFATSRPLSLDRVRLLRDRVKPYRFPEQTPVDAYLGIDVGSVGTKLVLVDEQGEVIHSIFTRTEGRPIEVVSRCLGEMEEAVGLGRARAGGRHDR